MSSEGKEPRGRAPKVLVVDSDARNVRELGVALRRRGWEPLEATSFEEGKRLWSAERPAFLIADVRLGQFNGLQLLLRARNDRPDVVAIITCAVSDRVLEAETERFGGTFLVKPLLPDQIVTLLSFSRSKSAPAQHYSLFEAAERRFGDRRRSAIPGFTPERRSAERRRVSIGQ